MTDVSNRDTYACKKALILVWYGLVLVWSDLICADMWWVHMKGFGFGLVQGGPKKMVTRFPCIFLRITFYL